MHDIDATVEDVFALVNLGYVDDIAASNVEIVDNTVTSSFFVAPLFGYYSSTATYDNVSIVGNTVTADYVYAGGFWHFGLDIFGVGNSTLALTNAVLAGNDVSAETVLGGAVLDIHSGYGVSDYTNVTVHGNTVVGDEVWGLWTDGEEQFGIQSLVSLVNVDVSGNSVTANQGGAGFYGSPSYTSYTFAYSNLVGLGAYQNLTDPTGSDGNLSTASGFTDVSSSDPTAWDLTLATGSALIDAGDPAITDPDGTVSDIGAYGGPGAANW